MSSHRQWLRDEIAKWRTEGLVDAATASRLLARYPAPADRAWGRLALSAIGAVLIGLGVILFFAYNWNDLPKAVKLGLVFAALFGAHGTALAVARRQDAPAPLVEGLHLIGTMVFGAGIWLVPQIYHIEGHYPNAFLVWALGALAMAWAMPSIVQALLALALVAWWAGLEAFEFHDPRHAAPLLAALGTLPLAWWRRSPMLLFFGLAVSLLVTAFAVALIDSEGMIPIVLVAGGAAFAWGVASARSAFPGAEWPARGAGLAAVVFCLFVLSFRGGARLLTRVEFTETALVVYLAVAVACLVAAAWALVRKGVAGIDRPAQAQLALTGAAIVLVLAFAFVKGHLDGWTLPLVFNALVLALALAIVFDGSERSRPSVVGAGCLVFAAVVLSRYVDLFSSLLARAAVFVLLGAGLFWVGNFYSRQRRRAEDARS